MLHFTIDFTKYGVTEAEKVLPPLSVTPAELGDLLDKGEVKIVPMRIRAALLCTVSDRERRFLGRTAEGNADAPPAPAHTGEYHSGPDF